MSVERLLLISPVRNEAAHIERVVAAVAAQTRPPHTWIVVDDGSEDSTVESLRSLEQSVHFMQVLVAPQPDNPATGVDRLAVAAEARALNWALRSVEWETFTHLGKLDGDVELPPDYFERLLAEFAREPSLGIAGGGLVERFDSRAQLVPIPRNHVHGALKLYTRECFEAVGGIQERLGWDTIDETYAQMLGFSARTLPRLTAEHHRHSASDNGRLRGRARHGRCAYIVRQSPMWVALRSLKVAATARPFGASGLAFLYGYFSSAARRVPKVEDEEFRRFIRRMERERFLGRLRAVLP
jgi:biofilm PGA synthesis N-glycosyltransferase PgaC